MVSWFVYGVVTGLLAAARSRDAYGHSQGAILAFIPVANLWLYFTRSRDVSAAMKPIWLTRGFVGVLLGIGFLISGNAVVKNAASQRVTALFNSETLPREIYSQFLVNNIGLKDTLDFLFGGMKVPVEVDVTTILVGVDVTENTVEYTYRAGLLGALFGFSESETTKKICGAPINFPLLRAGATFRHVVNNQNGRELANVTVARQDCGL
ncbi:MAG: hypothetical protein H6R00_532 [Proteobacteria bacterium]|nr:hypothetical protein [Pseudomonadota bacterium]